MGKTKLFIVASVVVFLLLLLNVSSAAATVSTFTVTQASQTQFLLPAGTTFNGSLSVSSTLRFWVTAPDGSQIVNLGLIDDPASFGFVAPQDGNYTMNFENGLPMTSPIQVTFTYSTNPDVTSNNSSGTPLAYWVAMSLIFILGVVLIVFLARRKKGRGATVQGEATSNSSVNRPGAILLFFRA